MASQLVLNMLIADPHLCCSSLSLSLSTLLFLSSLHLSLFIYMSSPFSLFPSLSPHSHCQLSFLHLSLFLPFVVFISLSTLLSLSLSLSSLLLPYFLLLYHSKGLLVLKELGFEVETYIASEIDPDAVKVTRSLPSASIPDYTYSYLQHSI